MQGTLQAEDRGSWLRGALGFIAASPLLLAMASVAPAAITLDMRTTSNGNISVWDGVNAVRVDALITIAVDDVGGVEIVEASSAADAVTNEWTVSGTVDTGFNSTFVINVYGSNGLEVYAQQNVRAFGDAQGSPQGIGIAGRRGRTIDRHELDANGDTVVDTAHFGFDLSDANLSGIDIDFVGATYSDPHVSNVLESGESPLPDFQVVNAAATTLLGHTGYTEDLALDGTTEIDFTDEPILLAPGFAGQEFQISQGEFIPVNTDGSNGSMGWKVDTITFDLVESIFTTIPGDYNEDGVVDGADYTVWRNAAPEDTLPNDYTPGVVSDEDFAVWDLYYGLTNAGETAAIPEPAAFAMASVLFAVAVGSRKRS